MGRGVPKVGGAQLAKTAGQIGPSAELQSIGCADSERSARWPLIMEKKSINPQLIDRIYESSFVPELWPDVLDELGRIAEAPGGRCSSPKPRFNIGPLLLRSVNAREEW